MALSRRHCTNVLSTPVGNYIVVLGTVTSFKYLGAIILDDNSKPEILSRIAQATAALTKLKPVLRTDKYSTDNRNFSGK